MSSKDNRHDDLDQGTGTDQDTGKVAHAHNSTGDRAATQTNQGRRTPESRGDRDTHLGSGNQGQSRQGGAGSSSGGGSRGAG